jgi:hypothetical protein
MKNLTVFLALRPSMNATWQVIESQMAGYAAGFSYEYSTTSTTANQCISGDPPLGIEDPVGSG